jgi:excisionase family DNA binding protein
LTVPEAARRIGKKEETIRRWIRAGKLRARKVGTQHLIEEDDLALLMSEGVLPAPRSWDRTATGEPMPNWVAVIRGQREEHQRG